MFVNGANTKAAQIFTLVHELVHLGLGEAALHDADMAVMSAGDVERWSCSPRFCWCCRQLRSWTGSFGNSR